MNRRLLQRAFICFAFTDDDVPTTLSFRRSGEVSAKGVCRVTFTYKPSLDVQQESVATRKFLLRFDETSADDMLISVSMSTRKVPVYTRTSEVDFRCIISCSTAVQSWHLIALRKERFAFQITKLSQRRMSSVHITTYIASASR